MSWAGHLPVVYLPYIPRNIKMVSRTGATVATQQISKYTHITPFLAFNNNVQNNSRHSSRLQSPTTVSSLNRAYRQMKQSWGR